MKIQIVTLFPEMFSGVFEHSMLLKAQKQNLVDIEYINLRDFGEGERKTVDDTPYGGGDGMLLKVEPLAKAIEKAKKEDENTKVLLMTPRGRIYSQELTKDLSTEKGLTIVCGRYEGYDERITSLVDEEISVGEYVLTGGEIPAMAVVDSVTRLIPGVLGGESSAEVESFSDEMDIEYPQYTRPEEWRGMKVPEVLLSGNHQEIAKWRKEQSKKRSRELNK